MDYSVLLDRLDPDSVEVGQWVRQLRGRVLHRIVRVGRYNQRGACGVFILEPVEPFDYPRCTRCERADT